MLRRHLETGDETSLHEAYEFGRNALSEEVGVLDMVLLVWRAADRARADRGNGSSAPFESFVLECLSPFEMAYRGAREANEALRRLDERREEQARRIARELHDEAGQLLATMHLALERLRPDLAPGAGVHLEQAVALLRHAEEDIRRLSHELRPAILDDLGLMPALRFLSEGVGQRAGLTIAVSGSAEERLPPAVEIALYRVVQEALNNVARHARATRATIEVQRVDRDVVCRIVDDGRGFDPVAVSARGRQRGIGLDGMRERIARLGGALEVRSEPGRGTELLFHIPLEVTHEDARPDRR